MPTRESMDSATNKGAVKEENVRSWMHFESVFSKESTAEVHPESVRNLDRREEAEETDMRLISLLIDMTHARTF